MSPTTSLLLGSAIGFVGSIIGAILVSLWVEWCRSPRLNLAIPIETKEWQFAHSQDATPLPARTLQLLVRNAPSATWITRAAAQRCRATVTFHCGDGSDLFQRPMQGRWANSPQPTEVFQFVTPDGQRAFSVDTTSYIDIYPGENELLDVVIRYGEETECYVWNNETYAYPDRRTQHWKIIKGEYLMKVTITCSGGSQNGSFRLMNDGTRLQFHLLHADAKRRPKLT
jgi:hypothetical protein